MDNLKKTPLHETHVALKGRMVPFGGWDMPVQYSGVIAEHTAVRTKVGLFDVSHMGEFFISGDKARDFLNRVTTNDATKLYNGRCQYTLMCYENGTVVDDLIISQIDATHFVAIVNAGNIDKDFAWLNQNNRENVQLENASDAWALIAIQGPLAEKLVSELFGRDFSALKYYHFEKLTHESTGLYLFRTGYTGEAGFELMVPAKYAANYWNALLNKGAAYGIVPAGLGARDTLRLEASYPLYGHEISDQINPLEAGLGWVVKLDKGDFIGRQALVNSKEAGLKRALTGVELTEPGIAREQCTVHDDSGKQIGFITSGTHSPTLKKAIAMALVDKNFAVPGTEFLVDIRGAKKRARAVKLPFYKR